MGRTATQQLSGTFVVVLGTVQDGGFPQPGCSLGCCDRSSLTDAEAASRSVACLGIVDSATGQRWLIDCTPDFPQQLNLLNSSQPDHPDSRLDGILLTHAHVGHYAGLVNLGTEIMCMHDLPVHAMPRMSQFLQGNDPWRQLVQHSHIKLMPLRAAEPVALNERISVTPLPVPHRSELSETVGFLIAGPQQKVLYIPDIDSWEHSRTPIESLIDQVDVAFLDGTFFDNGELPHRDMSTVPHPTIFESMVRFALQPAKIRERIRFIHFNHTNPALRAGSSARRKIFANGYQVATEGDQVPI